MAGWRWFALGSLFAALLIARPVRTHGQRESAPPAEGPTALTEKVEQFLRQIAGGDSQSAFESILQGSLVAEQESQVENLQEQAEVAARAYGAFVGIERLRIQPVGQSLVFFRYLYKTEQIPLLWSFAYYRTGEGADWKLVMIRLDVDLEKLAD